jgi:hypothetical protein
MRHAPPALPGAISKSVRHDKEDTTMMTTKEANTRLREQFENEQLPQLLEKAKEQLLDEFQSFGGEFEQRLDLAQQRLIEEYEENELPDLLEKMEEQYRDQFENALSEMMA